MMNISVLGIVPGAYRGWFYLYLGEAAKSASRICHRMGQDGSRKEA
jgi:hypothetical protein